MFRSSDSTFLKIAPVLHRYHHLVTVIPMVFLIAARTTLLVNIKSCSRLPLLRLNIVSYQALNNVAHMISSFLPLGSSPGKVLLC